MLITLCSQANAIFVFENLLADLTLRPGNGYRNEIHFVFNELMS